MGRRPFLLKPESQTYLGRAKWLGLPASIWVVVAALHSASPFSLEPGPDDRCTR
jgi:hypothetical protein